MPAASAVDGPRQQQAAGLAGEPVDGRHHLGHRAVDGQLAPLRVERARGGGRRRPLRPQLEVRLVDHLEDVDPPVLVAMRHVAVDEAGDEAAPRGVRPVAVGRELVLARLEARGHPVAGRLHGGGPGAVGGHVREVVARARLQVGRPVRPRRIAVRDQHHREPVLDRPADLVVEREQRGGAARRRVAQRDVALGLERGPVRPHAQAPDDVAERRPPRLRPHDPVVLRAAREDHAVHGEVQPRLQRPEPGPADALRHRARASGQRGDDAGGETRGGGRLQRLATGEATLGHHSSM